MEHLRSWGAPPPFATPEQIYRERLELEQFDWKSCLDSIWNAWTPLSLIGSKATEDAYKDFIAQSMGAKATVIGPIDQKSVDFMINATNERYDALLQALRNDLGVDDAS
ncbi:hypothetical protein [Streptomyces sp. 11-1-2]|uniref:hypothetical protein n=1 Tax=Streptomyces sp. 11-1-2 TaxID=1851167 RepID=UPI0013C50263|nr:hypothetical protein [Streptomyces sp. 11-1-2]